MKTKSKSGIVHHIAHGVKAETEKYPWIVKISMPKNKICTGAIVDNQHVLSAAHCFHEKEKDSTQNVMRIAEGLKVYLGNDKNNPMEVSKIIMHESYNIRDYPGSLINSHDIAVLKLKYPRTDLIPICLPVDHPWYNYNNGDYEAIAAGFGKDENGKYPGRLMETPVRILSNQKCNRKLRDIVFR